MEFRPLVPLGEPLLIVISLSFVGHPLGGMGLDYTVSSPLLPISLFVSLVVDSLFF